MPSLLRKTPQDALGAPLDASKLYETITSHARGHSIYNPGFAQLRGSHEAVQAAPQLWVPVDASSEEKGRASSQHKARRLAELPAATPDPRASRIAGPIPPERRMRAIVNYHNKAGMVINMGDIVDSRDEFVHHNLEMFEPAPDAA